jgi:hypothetical protein
MQMAILQFLFTVVIFAGIMVGLSFFIKSIYFEQFMGVCSYAYLSNAASGRRKLVLWELYSQVLYWPLLVCLSWSVGSYKNAFTSKDTLFFV